MVWANERGNCNTEFHEKAFLAAAVVYSPVFNSSKTVLNYLPGGVSVSRSKLLPLVTTGSLALKHHVMFCGLRERVPLCRGSGPNSPVEGTSNQFPHFLFLSPALQFRALAPMYYRGSAAAIIVYDITKEVRLAGGVLEAVCRRARPLSARGFPLLCCRRRSRR